MLQLLWLNTKQCLAEAQRVDPSKRNDAPIATRALYAEMTDVKRRAIASKAQGATLKTVVYCLKLRYLAKKYIRVTA